MEKSGQPYKEEGRRKSIRLKDYDYSQAGSYFITLCAYNAKPLFGDVVDGKMRLNDIGSVVVEELIHSVELRQEITLDEFVVMPNHIHGIVVIDPSNARATRRSPL